MRGFGELCGGMSTTWWSDKHNLHHALTNVVGIDEDLMVDPALYLWWVGGRVLQAFRGSICLD